MWYSAIRWRHGSSSTNSTRRPAPSSRAEPDGHVSDADLRPPIPVAPERVRRRAQLSIARRRVRHGVAQDAAHLHEVPELPRRPRDPVILGGSTDDYEAELVAVIGRGGRDISPHDAWGHVGGLTAGQDISDRTLQFAATPAHFDLGKSRDTYGPIGPVVVSTDSFANPGDLRITCDINGERRQDDRTSNLVFDIPTLISYLSSIFTLTPGDLIFTGTPEGVGAASLRFLVDGDVISTTIEGIGTMTNRCRMPRRKGGRRGACTSCHRSPSAFPTSRTPVATTPNSGLTRDGAIFSTGDGGEQLRIVESPTRRLIELCIGADDPDDVARVTDQLSRLGVAVERDPASVSALEIHSGARAVVKVLPRSTQAPAAKEPTNGPGRTQRENGRAPGILRQEPDPPPQTRPRRHRHSGRRGLTTLLPRGNRVQDQRPGPGSRLIHAVLHRPPQPAAPTSPSGVPPSHVLAGGRCR